MLDTQAKALLQLMVERQVPPVNTLPPEQAREFYLVRKSLTQPDPPSSAITRPSAVSNPPIAAKRASLPRAFPPVASPGGTEIGP